LWHSRSHAATIALAAMELGKHVYVQKPLTWSATSAHALRGVPRK